MHRGFDVSKLTQQAEVNKAARNLIACANFHALLDIRHETNGSRNAPLLKNAGVIFAVNNPKQIFGRLRRNEKRARNRSEVSLTTEDLLVNVTDNVEHTSDRRETLRNILGTGNATGVNGTHRKLSTRLADGLSGYNADSRTDVDRTTGRKIPAVALLTHAIFGLAGKQRTEANLLQTVLNKLLQIVNRLYVTAGRDKNFAGLGIANILKRATAHEIGINGALTGLNNGIGNCLIGTAVLLAHNDVLRNVNKAASQIS